MPVQVLQAPFAFLNVPHLGMLSSRNRNGNEGWIVPRQVLLSETKSFFTEAAKIAKLS
jgi:hypothetical protein